MGKRKGMWASSQSNLPLPSLVSLGG
ncbi:rCG24175 [Rattus norvegicus]|uniref:RCG24175 n=1 Tax=Rattus norvegicus TaxID=10116 RepID=A6KAG3_RAT|nr:rCG24175 [Rattus norvegicus]